MLVLLAADIEIPSHKRCFWDALSCEPHLTIPLASGQLSYQVSGGCRGALDLKQQAYGERPLGWQTTETAEKRKKHRQHRQAHAVERTEHTEAYVYPGPRMLMACRAPASAHDVRESCRLETGECKAAVETRAFCFFFSFFLCLILPGDENLLRGSESSKTTGLSSHVLVDAPTLRVCRTRTVHCLHFFLFPCPFHPPSPSHRNCISTRVVSTAKAMRSQRKQP